MMKRATSLFLIYFLFFVWCIPVTAATPPKNLVILGDSIAAGHSLPDFNPVGNTKSSLSWSTLLAEQYGARQYNLAVGGHTTADLLGEIEAKKNAAALARADVICISIGGNNFLQLILPMLNGGAFSKEASDSTAEAILTQAEADLDAIFTALKTKIGENTAVLVQTLYNPYQYFRVVLYDEVTLSQWIGAFFDQYNAILRQKIEEHGFHCVDVAAVYQEIDNRDYLYDSLDEGTPESAFRALSEADPHPTVAGHRAIFEVYVNSADAILAAALNPVPAETQETAEETETVAVETAETMEEASETAEDLPMSPEAETPASDSQKDPDKSPLPVWLVFSAVGVLAVGTGILFLKKRT